MFFKSFSKPNTPLWLIAFLGNPGERYAKTRHNAGWFAAAAVENSCGNPINKIKFKALTATAELGGDRVFLVKPQTFMNLSGDAVAAAVKFYKIPAERVIAVFDDMHIPPGTLRIKRGGSDGGHNGIKSVMARLGTADFPRIKIGVGEPSDPGFDRVDWVTGKPTDTDLKLITEAAQRVPNALAEIIQNGFDSAMNKFN
ncbi:MAG: aminoacyl-tRNA hydrolase [Oscillospiraceae bacterium]|jgi:PTH1 family peptidyl-tRNA hydrolase|nr:aminoacyl-tRNA hydrolase [Oscillospiraceae bacterium]